MTPKRIDLDVNNIVKKYVGGMSENALSKLYRVNRWTIRQRLLEAGISPRGHSKAEYIKWERMSTKQRLAQTAAAHEASRGRIVSMAVKIKRAKTWQQKGGFDSRSKIEGIIFEWLSLTDIDFIPQQAIGPYNCDFGAYPVAVEIFGGNWHMAGERGRQRKKAIRYFLDHGWHCYIVVINTKRYPLIPSVTDHIISYVQQIRSHPSTICEYRMVGSNGEFIAAGCADDNEISFVSSFANSRDPRTGRYERIPR